MQVGRRGRLPSLCGVDTEDSALQLVVQKVQTAVGALPDIPHAADLEVQDGFRPYDVAVVAEQDADQR